MWLGGGSGLEERRRRQKIMTSLGVVDASVGCWKTEWQSCDFLCIAESDLSVGLHTFNKMTHVAMVIFQY